MMTSIKGRTAATEVCALSLSSTLPPTPTWYPLGRLAFSAAICGASDCTTVAACVPGARSACTVTVGSRSLRQTMGYSWPYSTEAIWLSGTVFPFGSGT